MKKISAIVLFISALCLSQSYSFAQAPSPSQELSGIERTRQLREKEKALEQQLEKKKKKPEIEEKLPEEAAPAAPAEKITIKKIIVSGTTLIIQKKNHTIPHTF